MTTGTRFQRPAVPTVGVPSTEGAGYASQQYYKAPQFPATRVATTRGQDRVRPAAFSVGKHGQVSRQQNDAPRRGNKSNTGFQGQNKWRDVKAHRLLSCDSDAGFPHQSHSYGFTQQNHAPCCGEQKYKAPNRSKKARDQSPPHTAFLSATQSPPFEGSFSLDKVTPESTTLTIPQIDASGHGLWASPRSSQSTDSGESLGGTGYSSGTDYDPSCVDAMFATDDLTSVLHEEETKSLTSLSREVSTFNFVEENLSLSFAAFPVAALETPTRTVVSPSETPTPVQAVVPSANNAFTTPGAALVPLIIPVPNAAAAEDNKTDEVDEEGGFLTKVMDGARCPHRKSWKRLRAKKGCAFFVCFQCGAKWRTKSNMDDEFEEQAEE